MKLFGPGYESIRFTAYSLSTTDNCVHSLIVSNQPLIEAVWSGIVVFACYSYTRLTRFLLNRVTVDNTSSLQSAGGGGDAQQQQRVTPVVTTPSFAKQANALFKSLIDSSNPKKKTAATEEFLHHHDFHINENPEDLSQYFSAVQGIYMTDY